MQTQAGQDVEAKSKQKHFEARWIWGQGAGVPTIEISCEGSACRVALPRTVSTPKTSIAPLPVGRIRFADRGVGLVIAAEKRILVLSLKNEQLTEVGEFAWPSGMQIDSLSKLNMDCECSDPRIAVKWSYPGDNDEDKEKRAAIVFRLTTSLEKRPPLRLAA